MLFPSLVVTTEDGKKKFCFYLFMFLPEVTDTVYAVENMETLLQFQESLNRSKKLWH